MADKEMAELPYIEELDGEECKKLRTLWEEVFWEDSEKFTDYYFQEKAARNHAFVLKIKEEHVSMLYLSPYPVLMRVGNGFAEWEINYVVGVATREKCRHRGYMDMLLRKALAFLREKEQPFTFLMPADPEIYRPYQFSYIYDKKIYLVKENAGKNIVLPEQTKPYDLYSLAEYASSYLMKNYDVFIRRDGAYYYGMEKELKAQNGGISLLWGEDGAIEGYFLYTEEEGKGEIQEAVFSGNKEACPVYDSGKKQPVIMARITDVGSMLSLLRTENGEIVLSVKIGDAILPENSGIWNCRITPEQAYADKEKDIPLKEEEGGKIFFECGTDIARLAGWVFGYRKAEECFDFSECADSGRVLDKIKKIKQLSRVFINEIV